MKTQVEWLIWAFLQWPYSTTGEIYDKLRYNGHTIRNITGRMSDAREKGVVFHSCVDPKGNQRYAVISIPAEQAIASEKKPVKKTLVFDGNHFWESPGIRFTMEPDDTTTEGTNAAR